jgi:hypothetical protein
MRTLYYGSRDAIEALKDDLHNIFKSGEGDKIRDVVHILTNEMNKVKATSLDEYRDYKVNGLKTPKTPKKDYSKIYELFKLERKWDENHNKYMYSYVSVPNGELLKNLENFRYNTYKYMGSYTDAEFYAIVAISEKDGSVSKFINYLFNRYLPEFAIRKIEDSNFDHYEHKLLYKITKIS